MHFRRTSIGIVDHISKDSSIYYVPSSYIFIHTYIQNTYKYIRVFFKGKVGVCTWLKVRQIWNDFFKPTFLPKNEPTNLTLLLVELFSFVFLEESEDSKKTFRN